MEASDSFGEEKKILNLVNAISGVLVVFGASLFLSLFHFQFEEN